MLVPIEQRQIQSLLEARGLPAEVAEPLSLTIHRSVQTGGEHYPEGTRWMLNNRHRVISQVVLAFGRHTARIFDAVYKEMMIEVLGWETSYGLSGRRPQPDDEEEELTSGTEEPQ